MPKSLQTSIAASLAVAVILLATRGERPSVLAATPSSACQSVTPQSVNAYAAAIDQALRHANADARANGENGSYAVAAATRVTYSIGQRSGSRTGPPSCAAPTRA